MTQLYDNIISKLKKYKCEYEEFDHEPVFTSAAATNVMEHPEKQGTKSLAIEPKKGSKLAIIVVTVSGHERINFKTVTQVTGIKKLSMCSEETIARILGTEIGGLAPFGYATEGICLLVSKNLFEQEKVYFNPGKNNVTICLSGTDFQKVMRAEGAKLLPSEP